MFVTTRSTTPRLVAAAALAADAVVVLGLAFAIGVTRVLVATGLQAAPADAALLDDLVAILPFVIAFGGAGVVASFGIVRGRDWADRLGLGVAIIGATVSSIGLVLLGVGRDPIATGQPAASLDAIAVIAAVLTADLVAMAALRVATDGTRAIRFAA
jgi:hypothetical protein